jgi:Glyoxalase-like domain
VTRLAPLLPQVLLGLPGRRAATGQAVGERSYVLGPDTAAAADEPHPAVGPGDRLLKVPGRRQAAEYPVRRLPVAGLGVDPDGPGEVAADDLDRRQARLGLGPAPLLFPPGPGWRSSAGWRTCQDPGPATWRYRLRLVPWHDRLMLQLLGFIIDCPDPMKLAAFYSQMTGHAIMEGSGDDMAGITFGEVDLAFQRVEDYRPPRPRRRTLPASGTTFATG